MANNYSNLLRDPRWQKKRLLILERDNFTCTLCMDSRTTLHVHHEAYLGNPWDISDDKLRTVCLHCHDIIHAIPDHNIAAIHKRISLNAKCWEVVAFAPPDIVFLYLFFDTEMYTGKTEIVTIFTTLKNAA